MGVLLGVGMQLAKARSKLDKAVTMLDSVRAGKSGDQNGNPASRREGTAGNGSNGHTARASDPPPAKKLVPSVRSNKTVGEASASRSKSPAKSPAPDKSPAKDKSSKRSSGACFFGKNQHSLLNFCEAQHHNVLSVKAVPDYVVTWLIKCFPWNTLCARLVSLF